jgi:hypothetical protein
MGVFIELVMLLKSKGGVEMYFCLKYEQIHQKSTAEKTLTTGFRTIISTKEKYPLGFCKEPIN